MANEAKGTYSAAADLAEAREEYTADLEAFQENIDKAVADIDMLHGENQWPEAIKQKRESERRPCLTFNKLPQFVDQTIGANRRNAPQIRISASDGLVRKLETWDRMQAREQMQPDINGMPPRLPGREIEAPEVMAGLIRDLEVRGRANVARMTAMKHSVSHGFGHYRLLTKYVDDESFEQTITYGAVRNPLSVLWDAGSNEYTREDAHHCWITSAMPEASFKKKYPGAAILTFEAAEHAWLGEWRKGSDIIIAERFWKVPEEKTLLLMTNGQLFEYSEDFEAVKDELAMQGITVARERKVSSHKVMWRTMTGADVLDEREFPSRYIPVIPVWGKEICVAGRYIYRGVIRHSHDGMRQYNFQRTAAIEAAALQPKAPFMIGASQIGEYRAIWETANTDNHAYLPYDDSKNVNMPQRSAPPQLNQAAVALAQVAENDLYGTIGKYPPSLGDRTAADESGRAIIARQNQANDIDYEFPDNLGWSVEYEGRILVDMIPRLYDTERIITVRGIDDSEAKVKINVRVRDEQTGREVILQDIKGKYDVSVTVGPTFATQRMEAAESMLDFAKNVPNAGPAIGDLVAKNTDWPNGASDAVAKRLKKVIQTTMPGILDEEDQEPPTPEQQQAMAMQQQMQEQAMQAQHAEIEAKLAKAEADKADAAATIKMAEAKEAEAQYKMMALAAGPPPGTQTGPQQTPANAGVSASGLPATREDLDNFIRDRVADALAEFTIQSQAQP